MGYKLNPDKFKVEYKPEAKKTNIRVRLPHNTVMDFDSFIEAHEFLAKMYDVKLVQIEYDTDNKAFSLKGFMGFRKTIAHVI